MISEHAAGALPVQGRTSDSNHGGARPSSHAGVPQAQAPGQAASDDDFAWSESPSESASTSPLCDPPPSLRVGTPIQTPVAADAQPQAEAAQGRGPPSLSVQVPALGRGLAALGATSHGSLSVGRYLPARTPAAVKVGTPQCPQFRVVAPSQAQAGLRHGTLAPAGLVTTPTVPGSPGAPATGWLGGLSRLGPCPASSPSSSSPSPRTGIDGQLLQGVVGPGTPVTSSWAHVEGGAQARAGAGLGGHRHGDVRTGVSYHGSAAVDTPSVPLVAGPRKGSRVFIPGRAHSQPGFNLSTSKK